MPGAQPTRKSLGQLLNMLDSINEGIYCIGLNGECTYCNQRCLEMLGFHLEGELLGRNMHDLIHFQNRDGTQLAIKDCKIYSAYTRDLNIHVSDEVFWRKDGTRFDVEYWSYPIKENDDVVGAVVTFSDITLTRMESAHRNQLARLVQTSHDAIISKDMNGVITSWNQGAKEIYGYDAEEAVGQPPSFLLPDDLDQEEPEVHRAIRMGNELPQFHVKRRRKNGEICDVSVTISPLYSADQELIGSSSIERDITESRRTQDAILRAITAAEHAQTLADDANKSRTEFLANVSHELRTPMNAILGMLNLTLEEKLDPLVVDYLTVAKSSASSLLELVDELLDFAKIEAGKFEITTEPFELREAIDLPAKSLAPQACEKGLEILCEVDSEIPSKLVGDGRRIQQVIANLLSNAVKFTQRGEIVIKVQQIRELPSEVRLQFSVSDTGIGISPADLKQVLLPFKQADMSSTRKHHGTGLGLSICRDLVSLMGGKLKVNSQLGKGSRFYFELSLLVEDAAKPSDQLPAELVEDLRVLIVDDNPTNLRILEKIFVSWSMQPIVSNSAQQALRILKEAKQRNHKISLAIVDALMPQVDGFDFAEKLSDRSGATPPIVMMQSAADFGLHAERKAEANVAHFLTKPVSQSELLNAVVDTLDLYSHPAFRVAGHESSDIGSGPAKPLSILIVEDLPANQKVVQAILNKRGHSVDIAANGRVAVEKVQSREQNFDLILMDVQMPVMDGLQATAAIRGLSDSTASKTPIIAMTAHAMKGDREACLAAGMDAYIAKPLDVRRIVELVESIVLKPVDSFDYGKTNVASQAVANASDNGRESRETGSGPKLVDYEASLKRLGNDENLFAEFVEIFMADAPELRDKIAASIRAEDGEALEKSAHALKGLMSNFGARICCDLAQKLEQAGRARDVGSVRDELTVFDQIFEQLCVELQQCSA